MVKLSLVWCALVVVCAVAVVDCAAPLQAPAPSVDCNTIILNMADCLSFVSNGSKVSKPEGTCCTGLKSVLKAKPECLCEVFKNSAQLGIVLNVTKALTLPVACGVSAPSFSNCGLSVGAPGASPGLSPMSSSSPLSPGSAISGGGSVAPAPASGAASVSISFLWLLVSVVVASCSYF